MALTFELMSDEEVAEYERRGKEEGLRPWRPPPIQCPGCGRFAKFLQVEHYYNGNWNCVRTWTDCTKCGEQAVELV